MTCPRNCKIKNHLINCLYHLFWLKNIFAIYWIGWNVNWDLVLHPALYLGVVPMGTLIIFVTSVTNPASSGGGWEQSGTCVVNETHMCDKNIHSRNKQIQKARKLKMLKLRPKISWWLGWTNSNFTALAFPCRTPVWSAVNEWKGVHLSAIMHSCVKNFWNHYGTNLNGVEIGT